MTHGNESFLCSAEHRKDYVKFRNTRQLFFATQPCSLVRDQEPFHFETHGAVFEADCVNRQVRRALIRAVGFGGERTVNCSQSRAMEYPNIVISIATGHDGLTPIRRTIKRRTDIFEEAALAEAMPHPPGL